MQLQELTRQVFVEADDPAGPAALRFPHHRTIRADGPSLVEIDQHRRMPLDRQQEVRKPAEDMGANRLELQASGQGLQYRLVGGNRKVIGPERSEARRVGKECVRTGRSRWAPES